MSSTFLLGLPALLFFGSVFWLIIYLQTYRHFPKMEQRMRVRKSIIDATIMTLSLLAVVFVALYFTVLLLAR